MITQLRISLTNIKHRVPQSGAWSRQIWSGLAALTLLAAGCTPATPTTPLLTQTAELPPTVTPVPPSATAEPSPSPLPSATPLPNPLNIEYMRTQAYPGSEVTIEQNLTAGSNYRRYLASYRSEGLKIYALLTVPFNRKPAGGYPVIIFNHGYIPPSEYQTTQRYVAYVDALARSGYIVFRPDYRGHGNSEGVPGSVYSSPAYTIDVLNAVASMKQYPDANPDRIGMWGHSMGGSITLRNMVIEKDVKVGVIWAGVVASYPDLFSKWRRPSSVLTPTPIGRRGWGSGLASENGTPDENPTFWDSISPNAYLTDLSGPLQLHAGTADKDVPFQFSESLYNEVVAAGKNAELYLYKGDNHNISANFKLAMQRTIEFFDRYLKG